VLTRSTDELLWRTPTREATHHLRIRTRDGERAGWFNRIPKRVLCARPHSRSLRLGMV
ncbi:glycosyl hydrolases family 2, sugar binding domain protein, partial [Vibrio parahaemolyticus 861]